MVMNIITRKSFYKINTEGTNLKKYQIVDLDNLEELVLCGGWCKPLSDFNIKKTGLNP